MRASPITLRLLASAVVAASVGCQEPTFSVPTVPVGVLSVFARSEAGVYLARPQGLFGLGASTPPAASPSTADTCQAGSYTPQPTIPNVEHVSAGDSIVFAITGSGIAILRPVTEFGLTFYAAQRDVEIVPGAEVTFTIPGAVDGFPASEITSLTPTAVTAVSPILARPSLDAPLTVTWEPAGDDGSRFEVQLIYASQGAADFNTQVVCDWQDDGSGMIQPQWLGGWALSELQRIEVTRYRTQQRQVGENLLYLLTTFDTVPPVAP